MTELNPEAQAEAQAVLTQLAASVALLPQEIPEGAEPPPEGAIALPVIEQDGTSYVPVFTSPEALAAAGADPATAIEVPLAQLAAGWPDDELWLGRRPGQRGGAHPAAGRGPGAAGLRGRRTRLTAA